MSNAQNDAERDQADPSRPDGAGNAAELEETQLAEVSGAGYPQGKDPADVLLERWRKKD